MFSVCSNSVCVCLHFVPLKYQERLDANNVAVLYETLQPTIMHYPEWAMCGETLYLGQLQCTQLSGYQETIGRLSGSMPLYHNDLFWPNGSLGS